MPALTISSSDPLSHGEKISSLSPSASNRDNGLSQLIDERSWDDVLLRLMTHPQEASERIVRFGSGQSLPLHEACMLQAPANVVSALLAVNSEAANTKGQWSYLPIHFAARSNSGEAVAALQEWFPEGVRSKGDKAKLPIHLACQWRASSEIVHRFLMEFPESIYERDDDGKIPLDYAERNKVQKLKSEVIAVLECGPAYCAVSRAGKSDLIHL